MIADDTCRAAVHGDNYVRGLIPGTEIDWSVMQINHDCYVTITVDYGFFRLSNHLHRHYLLCYFVHKHLNNI